MGIAIEAGGLDGKELEAVVNNDLQRFEVFFTTLGNDGLNGYERAAIKTYLYWKTHGEPEGYTGNPKEKASG